MKLKLLQASINDNSSCGNYNSDLVGLFVDTETGVEYFIITQGVASAICPRLDRDGKPMINKQYY